MFERLRSHLFANDPSRAPQPAGPSRRNARARRGADGPETVPARRAAGWLREHREAQVLDVRTAEEFAAGHIPGARNLDYFAPDFAERAARLDRHRVYLVHCGSGHRGSRARNLLSKLGFQRVFALEGGLKGWIAEGNRIETSVKPGL